jgi:hypothetical protein
MPGTTWPVNGHPPGSSRDYPPAPVSMPANLFRHVNGYNARLPDPRLTREPGLLPHRSPRQSSANAAVGGLKPPPAGRLRRANNPSSPVQHHLKKLAYHAPFSVRDTRGSRLSRWPAVAASPDLPAFYRRVGEYDRRHLTAHSG